MNQWFPNGNKELICMPLPGHFVDNEGQVLVHQGGEMPTQSNVQTLMVTRGGSYNWFVHHL